MGGGVALLDYNNDGLLDLLFVNGGRIGAGSFTADNPNIGTGCSGRTATEVSPMYAEAGLAEAGDGTTEWASRWRLR